MLKRATGQDGSKFKVKVASVFPTAPAVNICYTCVTHMLQACKDWLVLSVHCQSQTAIPNLTHSLGDLEALKRITETEKLCVVSFILQIFIEHLSAPGTLPSARDSGVRGRRRAAHVWMMFRECLVSV